MIKVVIGTNSFLKFAAVAQALAEHNIKAEIVRVKARSGVGLQPFGDETEQGARNRAAHAQQLYPGADIYFGIEDGLFEENGNYFDKAAIVTVIPNRLEYITYSEKVAFPKQAVEEARAKGFDKMTVGQVLMKQNLVSDANDPHLKLSGKSRVSYLIDTLNSILAAVKTDLIASHTDKEASLIIDQKIRQLVSDLEQAAKDRPGASLKEEVTALVDAVSKNCAKPGVRMRYEAHASAEADSIEAMQNAGRYPIDNAGYAASFDPLCDEDALWRCWTKYGAVVGKGLISGELCAITRARVEQITYQLSDGKFDIYNPETHQHIPLDDAGTPVISRGFFDIYHDNSLAQLRQNVRVYLQHVILRGQTALWTTFDRYGIKLPDNEDAKGLPLHVDQNPVTQPDFETVQGVIALADCPLERGTLVVVPGSRHAFQQYRKVVAAHARPDYKGEYVELQNHDSFLEACEVQRQPLPLREGDGAFWDSRTTHANTTNISDIPRIVAYISACPAKEDQIELVEARRQSFVSGIGSNNRPAGLHASKRPRFTNYKELAGVREPESLNYLGQLLYGQQKYSEMER